ncbi:MAG TPA: tetratricopeptide repeat protein [Pyrinomonadaceae bacterium]|nr:tetratricopeptide repeat protein [Pyrinomonadaceae bacterium]
MDKDKSKLVLDLQLAKDKLSKLLEVISGILVNIFANLNEKELAQIHLVDSFWGTLFDRKEEAWRVPGMQLLPFTLPTEEKRPHRALWGTVITFRNLAYLHCSQEKFTEAEAEFIFICSYSRFYVQDEPELILPIIADCFNSLGIVYGNREEYEKAEIAFKGALAVYNEMSEINVINPHKNLHLYFNPPACPITWEGRVFTSSMPDKFFDAEQISKLEKLMERHNEAINEGRELPEKEQEELDKLIEEELEATIERLENKEKLTTK